MAKITFFLSLILIAATSMLFYEFEQDTAQMPKEDYVTLVFEDSIMYKMNTEGITTVLKSKKATRYNSGKTVLYNGAYYARTKEKQEAQNTLISAKFITQIGSVIKFNQNVNYVSDDNLTFNTEELVYNRSTKNIHNQSDFVAKQNNNTFVGNTIFIHQNNRVLKAQNVEFIYVD